MNSWLERTARTASWVLLLGRGIFLSVIVLLIIMRSALTVVRIDGRSMDPTLTNGQWVMVNLLSKQFTPWGFGDIAILRFPGDPVHSLYVKRIIGVPGDAISLVDGGVKRNGKVIYEPYLANNTATLPGAFNLPDVVPENQYLVFGDNRQISNDSRFFGLVPAHDLVGKVMGY